MSRRSSIAASLRKRRGLMFLPLQSGNITPERRSKELARRESHPNLPATEFGDQASHNISR
jgi:hypothetical protein